MAKATDVEAFKAQIMKELREQITADLKREAAAASAAKDAETSDAKDFRKTRESVNARFVKSVALTGKTDVLHLLATAFRKAGHHLLTGRDAHRSFELVAEELEAIATESEAIAPSASETEAVS